MQLKLSFLARLPLAALAALLTACGGGSYEAAPVTPSASFAVKAAGANSLMPSDLTTAQDPTLAGSAGSGAYPYFVASGDLGVAALKTLMANTTTYPREETAVTVTVGADTYKGYRLADVVVRATRLRPADYNTGAFGVTAAVIATGADGKISVFSFTELIRTLNGEKTIVAYEKNGAALPAAEGAMAVVAANDNDPALRRINRLSQLRVRNDYVKTSFTLASGATAPALTPKDISFTVQGAVKAAVEVASPVVSPSSSQGYYAVRMIGDKDVDSFKTYYFQEYGPRHMNFWWGQGVRLTDVLDTAGLNLPAEKNRCFVVIQSSNNQHALFSCGELYNSGVGVGDGLAGEPNRSRSKGVLLVTDDLRQGSGNGVMMTCWNDLFTCTKNNAGDPAAYDANLDANGDKVNYQSVALVSTEDKLPFVPYGRWYPMPTTCANSVWKCNAWIDVGERMQQGIKSITVFYADAAN